MRKSALLPVLFLFMSICLNCFAGEKVQLTNGEWPPLLSKELKNYGVVSHIVTEAFALEGIKVEYKFYPWKRALNRAEKGLADGSVIWAPTPKRVKAFYFSDPVIRNEKVFFYMKSHPFDWDTIDDLKGIIFGGPGPIKYDFEKKEYIDYRLKEKIVSIIDTAYIGEQGVKEILERSTKIIKNVR